MNMLIALTKKEFRTYFVLPIAYVFITVFLIINSWLFFKGFFLNGQADLRPFFGLQPILFLFFIPALTMRIWAEEKKQGTFQYLMTLPSNKWNFVVGKFLASWLFMILLIALTITIPVTVAFLGNLQWGIVITGYLGLILMAGAYTSIGVFASSITDNQIIAFILGVALCFIIWIIGEQFVVMTMPEFISGLLSYLGLGAHFSSIQRGVVDLRDIVYYISVISGFLFLNKTVIDSRKWEK